jgi:peptide-methionine (S)-S-oxide reductase
MTEQLTVGGGCFWCLEAVFEKLQGVVSVVSGYSGGRAPNPSYERVCSGATGHAEVIQITYDTDVIGTRDLLELFFAFHDPTTLNRQGPDTGTQYRSVIFFASPEQEHFAREMIATLDAEQTFGAPIVTQVVPLEHFWPAEAHHQHYFERNPGQGYCSAMIAPKVAKLRRSYASRLKPESSAGRPA